MHDVLKWEWNDAVTVLGVFLFIFTVSAFQLKIGQMKTRDAQRKADVEIVARALRAYKSDHEILPVATESGKIRSCGKNGGFACEWGEGKIVDGQNVVYMEKLPIDPFNFKGWKYVYDERRLYVGLENKNDKGVRKGLTLECGNGVQCNWYVEI